MNFYMFADENAVAFNLSYEEGNKSYRAKWTEADVVNPQYGDSVMCPACDNYISSRYWKLPRKIRLSSTKYPDCIHRWTPGLQLLFSEYFKTEYEKSGLTGIKEFVPVEVVNVSLARENSMLPPQYYSAELTISSTKIEYDKSFIKGQPHEHICPLCNPKGYTYDYINGLHLDAKSWTGEDIFFTYAIRFCFLSSHFADFCKLHDFKNMKLIAVSDFRYGRDSENLVDFKNL